ncbi:MAG: rhombosortase [Gammaproteobacteria bacterium]
MDIHQDQPPKNFNFFQLACLPALITILILLLALGEPSSSELLQFDRNNILAGEYWRLITGHFVHLGWQHVLMNLLGLALIWALFGQRYDNFKWLITITVSALFISAGLLLFDKELIWYVGFSGVLHGMFVAGAIASICAGYRAEIILVILLSLKLVWEQIEGALPGSAEFAGGNVVVNAHLYGAIAGLIIAIGIFIAEKYADSSSK